jgi:Calmodulin-binding
MTLLSDHDRIRTLNALKDRKNQLINSLSAFPIVIELQSVKRRKNAVEEQLNEVEHGIELFSRPKVFVPTEEYENIIS